MIKINRGAAPPAIKIYAIKSEKALDGITLVTKAALELEKAIAFFDNPANYAGEVKLTDKNFTFAVYKDSELANALETALGRKCSYCESRFAHVTPKDIEHFRPKSEINTGTGTLRPGYFWLAGDWENLLVSCPDCNRSRNHEVPGQSAKVKLGKGTQFPLSSEAKRLRRKGPIASEERARLLLNPCLDHPEKHLKFDENGLIFPVSNIQGKPSKKGVVSITAYALQRKLLVEERLLILNQLRFNLNELSRWVQNHNTLTSLGADAPTLSRNSDQIRAVRKQLRSMLTPDAPYLGMLRGWLRSCRERVDYDDLLQFGIDPTDLI